MPRCRTPDHLIGIGGGGSKVVYQFMEQDWILEEVLDTDTYEDDGGDRLQTTIIDTAVDDTWHDERFGPIERNIDRLIEDSSYTEADEIITFTKRQLLDDTNGIPDHWTSNSTLTSPAVNNLADDQDLNSWWVKPGREPLSKMNDSGFGGGVQRRRSVSKMLYHIAEYEDIGITPHTTGDDEVCIVASLGGGTGSGMALNLASNIESQRTHLFAIIPHEGDKPNQKTNAHAALSELEYSYLTGEGPFDMVTLIPYIDGISDDEFEKGVVRTIIAQQNAIKGGNFTNNTVPSDNSNNAPPGFAPFTLAVPYTVMYDIDKIDRAKREVRDVFESKRDELEAEAGLYTVVEEFLKSELPDSAGAFGSGDASFSLESDWGRDQAAQLVQRIDKIRGTFLEQDSLLVADLSEAVTDITNQIDTATDEEEGPLAGIPDADDIGELERARLVIDDAPEYALERFENNLDYDETDELAYELVRLVEQEFRNIKQRRDLWKATAAITSEETGISEDDAAMIRTALRDIVLDTDIEFASNVLADPKIDHRINELEADVARLVENHAELTAFHEHVTNALTSSINSWRVEAESEAEVLAAINKHRRDAIDSINTLCERVRQRISRITSANTADGVDSHLDFDFDSLNDELDEMDVEQIDGDRIRAALRYVADAKRATIEHNSGMIPGRPDQSQEFDRAVRSLADYDMFTINEGASEKSVDDPFRCSFDDEAFSREPEIDERASTAIESIAEQFESEFGQGGESFVTHSLFDHVESDSQTTTDLTVPRDSNLTTVTENLKAALEGSESTKASELLDNVAISFPLEDTSPTVTSLGGESNATDRIPSITLTLFDAFLNPIAKTVQENEDRLSTLGDNDITEESGLIELYRKINALAGSAGTSYSDDEIDLPEANPMKRGGETYGRDFAQKYDGLYKIRFDDNLTETEGTHPYIKQERSDHEDLIGDPDDIAESNVIENHRDDDIFPAFRNSIRRMFENRHGRAPINEFTPSGSGDVDGVEPMYGLLRYRPVYLSRGLEYDQDAGKIHDEIYDQVGNHGYIQDNELYSAEQYDSGGPDEVTMVMFISGLFLDNLSLASERNGYYQTYQSQFETHEFIPTHHSIGIGGAWDTWQKLRAWTEEDADKAGYGEHYGAIVYRDEIGDPTDEMFIDEILRRNHDADESPKDLFYEMMDTDTHESTIDMDR